MRPHTTHHEDCGCLSERFAERIAELESENERLSAEVERLKMGERCGSCSLFEIDWDGLESFCPDGAGRYIRCYAKDRCHCYPSRWQPADRGGDDASD